MPATHRIVIHAVFCCLLLRMILNSKLMSNNQLKSFFRSYQISFRHCVVTLHTPVQTLKLWKQRRSCIRRTRTSKLQRKCTHAVIALPKNCFETFLQICVNELDRDVCQRCTVVCADTVDTFKNRLDKFWQDQ